MKEHNIDKLFREKLAKGNFTYRDAYWQQAEMGLPTAATPAGSWLSGKYFLGLFLTIVSTTTMIWWYTNDAENTTPIRQEAQENSGETQRVNEQNLEAPQHLTTVTAIPQVDSSAEGNLHTSAKNSSVTKARSADKTASKKNVPVTHITSGSEEKIPPKSTATNRAKPQNTAPPETKSLHQVDQRVFQENSKATAAGFALDDPYSKRLNIPLLSRITVENTINSNVQPAIQPIGKRKNRQFSLGIDYSFVQLHRNLTSPHVDLARYTTFRNQYERPTYATSTGISLLYEQNGWLVQGGFGLLQIQEEVAYPSTLNVLTGVDNGAWQINEDWSYRVDSNWVIDSIYSGFWHYDTAWSVTYDSTWVSVWDSIYTEKEEPTLTKNNGVSSISYLEFPLFIGHSFGKNRLYFDIQLGGALGILTGTKGAVYSNTRVDGLVSPVVHHEQFRQYNAHVLLRGGVRFAISPQVQALFYPTFRYTITNVFAALAIQQRYYGYGLTLGLRYQF